jgi:hypothetical protein
MTKPQSASQVRKGSRVPDHDRFMAICERNGIETARADVLWRDLTEEAAAPAPEKRLSRTATATVVVGTVLLNAAGIWWAALVSSAAGALGLLGLAMAWVVVMTVAAELARRRAVASLDAAFSAIAVAYAAVAVGAALHMLAGSSFPTHWWGRAPLELALLGFGGLAVWRYRQPLLTMFLPTLAAGALAADALVSSVDGWDRDISQWPGWVAPAALGLAAGVTAVALGLDRRRMRAGALWPSLLADASTTGAILGIAAAAGAGIRGIGFAAALAGAIVFARGLLVGRLAEIAIGAAIFWIGVIAVGSLWGDLAVAGLTTLAGLSMITGAVLVARRGELITRRRGVIG